MFCTKCGKQLPDTAAFCGACGAPVGGRPAVEEEAPVVEETSVVEETLVVEETPAVEEAPAQVEAPVEEETSVEEEASVEEETPVEEEIPAEEENPAQETIAQKAAKPKKKKKGLIWALSIVAVLLVGALVAGLLVVKPYLEKKQAYNTAKTALADREYDKALEQFLAAKDYEDAQKQAEQLQAKQESYDSAVNLLSMQEFEAARAVFAELADYRDSAALIQQSYLDQALLYLSQQDVSGAMEIAEFMESETYNEFMDAYAQQYADFRFLADLEEALIQRHSGEEKGLYETAEAELNKLSSYQTATFADKALSELAKTYLHGLVQQKDSTVADGTYVERVGYYTGAYYRSLAVETLAQDFGLLQGNSQVLDHYVGKSEGYQVLVAVEDDLQKQLLEAKAVQGVGEKQYLVYTNHTKYAFTLKLENEFYSGQEKVSSVTTEAVIIPGEQVYLPVAFPQEVYSDWYVDWEVSGVTADTAPKAPAGTYKLQAMVVNDVYYDSADLVSLKVTQDSVIVTLNADGTGQWKELDTVNGFAYAQGVMTFTEGTLKLNYLLGENKLIVNVNGYLYILQK